MPSITLLRFWGALVLFLCLCSGPSIKAQDASNKIGGDDLIATFLDRNAGLDKRRNAIWRISNDRELPRTVPMQAIETALVDRDISIRIHGLHILGKCGGTDQQRIYSLIRRSLKDPDDRIRNAALEAIAQLGERGKPLETEVISMLDDQHWLVRRRATEALGAIRIIKDPQTVRKLETLESLDRDYITKETLGKLELDQQAIRAQFLTSYDKIDDFSLACAVQRGMFALYPNNPPILAAVRRALSGGSKELKESALSSLKHKPLPANVGGFLITYLKDRELRPTILEYLCQVQSDPHEAIGKALVQFSQDVTDENTRDLSFQALEHLAGFSDTALLRLVQYLDLPYRHYDCAKAIAQYARRAFSKNVFLIVIYKSNSSTDYGDFFAALANGRSSHSTFEELGLLGNDWRFALKGQTDKVARFTVDCQYEYGVFSSNDNGNLNPVSGKESVWCSTWLPNPKVAWFEYRVDLDPRFVPQPPKALVDHLSLKGHEAVSEYRIRYRLRAYGKGGVLLFEKIIEYLVPYSC